MENNEQVRSNESTNQKNLQSGNLEGHRAGPRRPGTGEDAGPEKDTDQTSFDSENSDAEINPNKLDREEINPDRSGADHSKGHEPYEFKNQQGREQKEDGPVSQDPNNKRTTGGAGGAQFGQGSNTPGRGDSVPVNRESAEEYLLGQGGYGSSEETHSNSTQGTYDNDLRGSNGGIAGQRSGKGSADKSYKGSGASPDPDESMEQNLRE